MKSTLRSTKINRNSLVATKGGITLEKVKLTKQQAEILETELNSTYVNGNKARLVKMYLNTNNERQPPYPLIYLSIDEFIRALYIGYEIKLSEEEKIQKYYLEIKEMKRIDYAIGQAKMETFRTVLETLGRADLIPKDGVK